MRAVDDAVPIEMIMASEYDVNKAFWCLFCELIVVRFALVCNCYDYLSALLTKARDQLLGCFRCRLVDQIWRERVDCCELL